MGEERHFFRDRAMPLTRQTCGPRLIPITTTLTRFYKVFYQKYYVMHNVYVLSNMALQHRKSRTKSLDDDRNLVRTEDQDKGNKLSAIKARLLWGSLASGSGGRLCHVLIFLHIAYPIGS